MSEFHQIALTQKFLQEELVGAAQVRGAADLFQESLGGEFGGADRKAIFQVAADNPREFDEEDARVCALGERTAQQGLEFGIGHLPRGSDRGLGRPVSPGAHEEHRGEGKQKAAPENPLPENAVAPAEAQGLHGRTEIGTGAVRDHRGDLEGEGLGQDLVGIQIIGGGDLPRPMVNEFEKNRREGVLPGRGGLQGVALAVESLALWGQALPGDEVDDSKAIEGFAEGGHEHFDPGLGQGFDVQNHGITDDRLVRGKLHPDLHRAGNRTGLEGGCFPGHQTEADQESPPSQASGLPRNPGARRGCKGGGNHRRVLRSRARKKRTRGSTTLPAASI